MKKQSKPSRTSKQKRVKSVAPLEQTSFKLNAFTVTMLVIGSFVVTLLLYIGLVWLIDSFHDYDYETSAYGSGDIALLIIVLALVFVPGLLAAAIAVIMMKKRRN